MPNGLLLIIICGGFLLALILICNVGGSYNLDGIKGKTVGDGQHGTARFATPQEIRTTFRHVPYTPELWRQGKNLPTKQGLILGCEKHGKKLIALIDDEDIHCLMIGAAGIGKTAFFLYPNLEYACASGMSFLTTDTKGDLARNYGCIAEQYGYEVSVIDLRNPTRSDQVNILNMVNKYMDMWLAAPEKIEHRAKAEKYAKIIAKTIVLAGSDGNFGQNSFFYESAESVVTSVILMLAEFCPPETRHIVSVYNLIQSLTGPPAKQGAKTPFQLLLDLLPEEHKARWFAGSTVNTSDQAMSSVLSTAMSRLNSFLDTEMEQLLCFDTKIDAERFCLHKSAVFVIMPEEDNSKYFMVSLIIQQMYREILAVADEHGGRLPNRVMMYLDELGTLPKIDSLEMAFSAIRSRQCSIVAIIQSFAQLERNYGKEGSQIVTDNCQDTIFGGFSPISESAERLSQAMGEKTVMTGSISKGKNDPSRSLQMTSRRLMTADELRSLPKGRFVVMKTGRHPMQSTLPLFLDWGISFKEEYVIPQRPVKAVAYANKGMLEKAIAKKYPKPATPQEVYRARQMAGERHAAREEPEPYNDAEGRLP